MAKVRGEILRNWMMLAGVIIIADQITKAIASAELVMYKAVVVMPMFNFTLMHNEGAAFSFLSDAGGWQRWFFTAVSLFVSILLVFWIKKLKSEEKFQAISFSLILGGAVGNLIDRVRFGYVVDFIEIYYQQYSWPAFNIADSAISIGVVVLIVDTLFPNLFRKSKE
jgi:signal peptidase II